MIKVTIVIEALPIPTAQRLTFISSCVLSFFIPWFHGFLLLAFFESMCLSFSRSFSLSFFFLSMTWKMPWKMPGRCPGRSLGRCPKLNDGKLKACSTRPSAPEDRITPLLDPQPMEPIAEPMMADNPDDRVGKHTPAKGCTGRRLSKLPASAARPHRASVARMRRR